MAALRESGEEVASHLRAALAGDARIRMFLGEPLRWMGYLVSHESHHRGQIMLALKQHKMRLPDAISIEGVWGTWMKRS